MRPRGRHTKAGRKAVNLRVSVAKVIMVSAARRTTVARKARTDPAIFNHTCALWVRRPSR